MDHETTSIICGRGGRASSKIKVDVVRVWDRTRRQAPSSTPSFRWLSLQIIISHFSANSPEQLPSLAGDRSSTATRYRYSHLLVGGDRFPLLRVVIGTMKGKSKINILTEEKKRKKKREKDTVAEKAVRMNIEGVNGISVEKKKKEKISTNRKRKNKDKNLVGRSEPTDEVHLTEQSDEMLDTCPSEPQEIADFEEHRETDCRATIKPCRSKKAKKKRKKEESFVEEVKKSPERVEEVDNSEVYIISSVDEDCSKGMKKWISEYQQSRPGLKVLQQQIDDFITAHEEKLERESKEKEALAADGGWTVVVHHKGRKKTTDSEGGIAVGSVAQAAVEDKMAKKKRKEVGMDFYRFQKKEAQRNEIVMLQSKFEEDKKRLQQLRAARKFRPY